MQIIAEKRGLNYYTSKDNFYSIKIKLETKKWLNAQKLHAQHYKCAVFTWAHSLSSERTL